MPCGRANSLTTVRHANVTKYIRPYYDMNWLNGKCLLRFGRIRYRHNIRRYMFDETCGDERKCKYMCGSYTRDVFGACFIDASDPYPQKNIQYDIPVKCLTVKSLDH